MPPVGADLWYKQRRFEGTKFWALRVIDVYETLGTAKYTEGTRKPPKD